MPVRLEVFLQFSFSNIVFLFLLHYTCSVLRSRNSRKAFKFLTKRLVLLLYGNLCFEHKTTYLWSMRSPGGGELSISACPGVGNRPPNENKIANPRGYARGGGIVTGRIEPCITGSEAADGMCQNNNESFNLFCITISLFEHLELLELRVTSAANKTMLFCVVSL